MKKGKYSNGRVRKPVALLLALVLVLGIAIGGTIAWLTDTTGEVKNTFTTSDVDIDLKETKTDFQMVPGHTIDKDPKVSVTADSEDCWLFVEITEKNNLDHFITYSVAEGWEPVVGETDGVTVIGRIVKATDTVREFSVLDGDKVTVNADVTKGDMDALRAMSKADLPSLTFKAYACQLMKDNTTPFTAEQAWDNVKPATP